MNYYDLTKEQVEQMNIDWDFCACLEYNSQPFNLLDVEKVLAVIEGENDGAAWHWVVLLKDNQLVYLRGACDYTGWDCQSWADCAYLTDDNGLEKVVKELSESWENSDEFVSKLQRQLNTIKDQTWREKTDNLFGVSNLNIVDLKTKNK